VKILVAKQVSLKDGGPASYSSSDIAGSQSSRCKFILNSRDKQIVSYSFFNQDLTLKITPCLILPYHSRTPQQVVSQTAPLSPLRARSPRFSTPDYSHSPEAGRTSFRTEAPPQNAAMAPSA
jgi:hypothetical protein